MRVSKAELIDAESRIRNFIKGNQREPNHVSMTDMDTGRDVEVPISEVNGLYFNVYTFWLKNGRYPNFATLNITKGEPTIQNYQDNYYQCGPTSLSMASTKLFKPVSETTCAQVLGTTKSGTNPANLVANSPALGFTVKAMARNPVEVQNALRQYNAVICHYETGDAPCSNFLNNYGHYALIKDISNGRYVVLDPTKGQFTCPTSMMDQATNGRSLYYYRVSLK